MIDKRRVIQLMAIVLLACGNTTLFGQTGPAGIGNSTGINGHPHNLVWLDATDLSVFSTGDSWLDKSGNVHNAVSSGANLSLGNINGVPALDFAAFTSGNFAIPYHTDFDDVDQLSIFVVYNSGTSTNPQGLVSKRVSTGNISFSLFQYSNFRLYADYISSSNRINGANNTSETNYIGNYIFQTNDSLKIYKNGILDNGAFDLTGATNTNNTLVDIEIGKLEASYSDGNNFKGKIAEIIIYKTNLSPIQRAIVVSYLSTKYGIGVQEVNLAYSATDGTYYEDLTGFGRSSAGFKGFGPSDGLYISLNDAGIGDYITAAHNGALNGIENIQTGVDVTASGAVAAWNRDWYVEKGGLSTAKISLSFPEAFEEGSFPQELSNYVLLRKDSPEGTYSQVNVSNKGVELGERVWFEVADADFEDGYYTLGTLDQSASPLEGGSNRTWYSLISGDWDNWEVWTLDPSGALPNNPNGYTPSTSPTAASDKVVVLNGKTVTASTNDKIHQQVTVDGRLDLQGTSGHNFGQIRGRGRILLNADHFPAGDATHFSSAGQGEGTVVYYGDGFEVTQNLNFFNLEVELASATDRITLLNDLTINGEFRVKNGEFQFNNGAATTALNVTVNRHVVVEENGKLLTGTANARHQFNLYGDFTNNGSVAFTNRISAAYGSEATDGIVDVNFLNGSKNQLAFFNGPSKMYRVEIDKGTDATYELILEATHADHFQLLGYANQDHPGNAQLTTNTNALGLLRGTVRVKSNINIPVLNNTGNYNISESARLWVDGGTVAKTSGTAIVPYGVIQVSAGTLSALVNSGITTRGNGLVKVEGGTLSMNQLRTSVFGSENVGGYVQSGGVTIVKGGSTNTDYYCFNLTYPGNVFNMAGGTLHIEQANSKGGVFINSDEVHQNVTGGTVIMEISDGNNFEITSRAPFWNVIIRNSHSGNGKHLLTGGTDVGATNESLPVQDLHVLNDLTIETGTTRSNGTDTYGSYLDLVPDNTNAADLYVGGNLTIEDSGVLDIWAWNGTDNSGSATVTFNKSKDAVLYVGDIATYTNALVEFKNPDDGPWPSGFAGADETYGVWTLPFYNLIIDKPNATLSLASKLPGKGHGSPHGNPAEYRNGNGGKNVSRIASWLLRITNKIAVLNGTFSQIDPLSNITWLEDDGVLFGDVGDSVAYSIAISQAEIINYDTLFVFEDGVTPITGVIRLRNSGDLTLKTKDGAYFGNFDVSTGNNVVSLTSDVKMGRLRFTNGILDIGTHNLKTDVFEFFVAASTLESSDGQAIYSKSDYIRMAGNASDGGLSIKLPRSLVPYKSATPTWPDPAYTKIYNTISSKQYYEDGQEYNTPDRVWFPIGTNAGGSDKYTPAVMFTADDAAVNYSGDEYVTVRLVNKELQTTNLTGGDIIPYYWTVNHEGFDEGLPEVSWIFQYDDSDIRGDESTYVPGKVLDGGSYTRSTDGDATGVKDSGASGNDGDILGTNPNNIILFNGITGPNDNIDIGRNDAIFIQGIIDSKWASAFPGTGITLENANYTAGEADRFAGAPKVYYNRRNATRNWNSNTSWYDSPTGTNNPPDFPTAGDVVVIRGDNFGDAIKVNGTQAAAEILLQREGTYTDIEDIPRLFLEPTDVLNVSKISGVGELYLRQSLSNTATVNADIGEYAANDTSVVIFYMTENGTYNVSETDLFTEFPVLRIYGQGANYNRTASFNYDFYAKQLIVDGQANLLVGGDYTVEIRTRLGYTQGGRILFPNGTESYRLKTGDFVTGRAKVGGDNDFQLTVQTGLGNGIEHYFEVEKNIDLNFADAHDEGKCTLDLFSTLSDNNVILHLSGEGNHTFNDNYSAGNSFIEFYKIEMNKGNDITSTYSFNDNFTLNGPTSGAGIEKALTLENGNLILNHPNINIDLTTGDDNFYIPNSAGLEVRQGQANANGGSGILLDGQLIVSGGTLDMSGGNNYIQYSASGNAAINISAGSLIVGSQIRRGLTSSEGILDYTQSGGTVVVGNDAAPENSRGVFEVLNSGSNFSFTGGELQIARAQNNPAFASVYLAPETFTTNNSAVLRIGYVNTPAGQTIGLYSNVEIPNLVIDNTGGNGPILRQWTVPLTVSNLLKVEAGAVFDANGNNLILKGDFLCAGDFIPNGNTTFFSGSGDQVLTGALTFFNLTKPSPGQLSINNSINIHNRFRHEDGLLVDNSQVVTVGGSLYMYGDHEWGGSGRGIVLNGIEQQMLYGSGAFGKLTTNNPEGIKVDDGNTVYINRALQMEQGVLNVGSNLLVLAEEAIIIEENPFSASNMIQTNISFTDNGVKKFLPSGAGNFIFPVGSGGKYTPVKLNITANNNGSGSLLVKPAGEAHPSVLDVNNVLNYHWVVRADGLSGFAAEARMKYDIGDVKGNISNYITARLLSDGSGEWNKFSGEEVIDESTRELVFSFFSTDDAGISGDYTAGLDAAIPNQVPTYITVMAGLWNNAAIWDTYPTAGGSVPESGPRGSMVVVSHAVEMPGNYTSSYRTTIAENGVLSIGSTFGHRLGEVFGSGVLSLESGDMPAGFYDAFLEESGGTLRFGGITSYDILSTIHQLNNLELTGSGTRRFPNIDVQLTGDLLIDGPQARNEQNRTISVKGDVVFESGSFVAGNGETSVFVLNGSVSQTLSGSLGFSGSSSFNRLTINNPAGVVFTLDADVKDVLNLTAGRVIVDESAVFRVDNYSAAAIVGVAPTRYIDGPLYKRINSGATFDFPLGNEGRYGNIKLDNVTVEGMWRAQYHSNSPSGAGLSTGSKEAPVQYVSSSEYWNIEAPAAATAEVTLRWDASSGVNPVETGLRGVQWLTDKWFEVTLSNVSGTSSAGTARIPSLTFNANAGGNYITFGAITIPVYTWTGATDTDWFKAGNWTNSTVPSASANTTIAAVSNLPEISGANVAQVNDLIIETGVTLTLKSGGRLTVNGDLNIAASSELVLDNSYGVNGMASLITHGQILGAGTTRLTLNTPSNQWFYLGSSVKDAIFSDFSAGEADIIINVYRANKWWGIKSGLAHRSLRSMEGIVTNLLLEGAPDRLIEYTGELHTTSVSRVFDESGYHLLANPYPSFISWEDAAGWERPNVSGTIWYRGKIGAEMAFITYNRDALPNAKVALYPDTEVTFTTEEELSLIPPMQAVWVSTAVPGVTVTVKPEARRHSIDGSRLKSSSASRYGDVIRIETENEFSRDGAVLYFSNGSEEAVDKGDSEKYFNDSERIPEIYTRVGEKALSINGLPLLNEAARTIPLSVRNRVAGEVTMAFDLSYYFGLHAPYLEDRETGAFINLLHENSYTYTVSETGENHDRFVLNFYYVATDIETPAGDETDAGSAITIKSMAGKVLVSVGMDLLQDGNGIVEIYTIEGRKISEVPARSSRTLILLPNERGVYIIRAKFGNQVKSGRVIGGM